MILHVVDAKYERDYIVRVKFNDGAEGCVDLSGELYGDVFAPLLAKEKFKTLRVDPELNTIVWANGADFAPEFLYERLLVPIERPDRSEGLG